MSWGEGADGATEVKWRPLAGDERSVLLRLLSAEFAGKKQLLEQATGASARTLDDDGSIALLPRAGTAVARVERRVPVEAYSDEAAGPHVHVLLHVVDGFLNELEFYRDDGAPVQHPIRPDTLHLLVLSG